MTNDDCIKIFLNKLQEYTRLNRSAIESLFFELSQKHEADNIHKDIGFGGNNRLIKEIQKYCSLISLNIKSGIDSIEKIHGKRVSVNTAITVLGNKFKQDIKPFEPYFAVEGNKISYGDMDFVQALPIYIPISKYDKNGKVYYSMFNLESLKHSDKKIFIDELKEAKKGSRKGLDELIQKYSEKSLDKSLTFRNITQQHINELRIFLNISDQLNDILNHVNTDYLKSAYRTKYK